MKFRVHSEVDTPKRHITTHWDQTQHQPRRQVCSLIQCNPCEVDRAQLISTKKIAASKQRSRFSESKNGTNLSKNIAKLWVSCHSGNDDRVAWSLFQAPRAEGKWLTLRQSSSIVLGPKYRFANDRVQSHGGYPGNRNVRYASHNMAYAQGAKIDMSISPSKRLSTRWFKSTQFNVAILIAMRRPNKSHLVEMRCYWWLKNRPVDRNVRSVYAAVNRNVKYREPQRI